MKHIRGLGVPAKADLCSELRDNFPELADSLGCGSPEVTKKEAFVSLISQVLGGG